MKPTDEQVIATLRKTPLFNGTAEDEVRAMMKCLDGRVATYAKGEYISRSGDVISSLGVVLDGSVIVATEDYWGNRNILSDASAGQLFGEAFACMPGVPTTVSVMAAQNCTVIFLDVQKIVTTCSSACDFHVKLVRNLLTVLARKNLALTRKTEHITKRTTRDKLLSYLSAQSQDRGSSEFDIPFNRQQLADYLSVERSALSSCLGKLQQEGVIAFHKSHFELK